MPTRRECLSQEGRSLPESHTAMPEPPLRLQLHRLGKQTPLHRESVLACSHFHPRPPSPTPFPHGQKLLSLLVKEGAGCHPRCWFSSKVLADKGLRLLGMLLIGSSGSTQALGAPSWWGSRLGPGCL